MKMLVLQGVLPAVLAGLISAQEALPGDPAKAKEALQVFKTRCSECHGTTVAKPKGSFGVVDDLAKLAAERSKIIRGEPDQSPLWKLVKDGDMPPEGKEPPDEGEKRSILEWIRSLRVEEPPRAFVSDGDILQAMFADLSRIAKESPQRVKRIRYLTLTNLWNLGESSETLQLYREAVGKLLMSLSQVATVVAPEPIDVAKTIFRFDLHDIGWDEADWLTLIDRYPYAIVFDSPTAIGVYGATGVKPPYVRGDWFTFEAAKAPLYYDLLHLPKTVPELEKQRGIDAVADIRNEVVARAGFKKSRVSKGNRIIERHALPSGGAYWKSYDFREVSDTGDPAKEAAKNIFARPLGPSNSELFPTNLKNFVFDFAGGEIIFSLPNGMQAYFLADAKGNRIDVGPDDIVEDDQASDHRVTNGISCMSCHVGGMRGAKDTLRDHVLQSHAFPQRVIDLIKILHPPLDAMDRLLAEDTKRFKDAMGRAGVRTTEAIEPVRALERRFEEVLDLKTVAAEVGFPPDQLRTRLDRTNELKRTRSELEREGVPRKQFINTFAKLVRELNLGELRPLAVAHADDGKGKAHDEQAKTNQTAKPDAGRVPAGFEAVDATPGDRGFAKKIRHLATRVDLVLIPAGTFTMGTVEYDDETPAHTVTISSFYAGETEMTLGQWKRFVARSGYETPGSGATENHPVTDVSWLDGQALCTHFAADGLRFLTEAEWEYACRSGSTRKYGIDAHGGRLGDFAWNNKNSDGKAQPVRGKVPVPFGLYDMHGNVWEWVQDAYDAHFYARSGAADPRNRGKLDEERVLRGGAFNSTDDHCRPSYRNHAEPAMRVPTHGLRLAKTLE